MRTLLQLGSNTVGTAVINTSRQVWLASLGAAVVTRDWAQAEGGNAFHTLVKQGTAIEARTFRIVGNRLDDSLAVANVFWKMARSTVQSTVRNAAAIAVSLMQNKLPKSTRRGSLPAMPAEKAARQASATKRAAPTKRAPRPGPAKVAKRNARAVKPSTRK